MSRLTRLLGLIVLALTGVLFIAGSGPANAAPTSATYVASSGGGGIIGCC
jgi:hypothetical protein